MTKTRSSHFICRHDSAVTALCVGSTAIVSTMKIRSYLTPSIDGKFAPVSIWRCSGMRVRSSIVPARLALGIWKPTLDSGSVSKIEATSSHESTSVSAGRVIRYGYSSESYFHGRVECRALVDGGCTEPEVLS